MRLWHKDLIAVLPRQQLLGQWRECCLIAKNIKEKGNPNHILVNKIMDYPLNDFNIYCNLVLAEMVFRGYNVKERTLNLLNERIGFMVNVTDETRNANIFKDWHNDSYFCQCCYNLQEKYDCGGISENEWRLIQKAMIDFTEKHLK